MRLAAMTTAAVLTGGGLAAAHPHVFVDAALTFHFDEAGQLEAVSTAWSYDEFYTLYAIEALEMDRDGDGLLTDDELAEMARVHTVAPEQEAFPSQIFVEADGGRVALALPSDAEAELSADRLIVRFVRRLETPLEVAGAVSARIYDPSYFIAYTVVADPEAVRLPDGCTLRLRPYDADSLVALQSTLAELSVEQIPADPDVGRLFADEMQLACG